MVRRPRVVLAVEGALVRGMREREETMRPRQILRGPMKGYWFCPGPITTGDWSTGQYLTADPYWSVDGSVKHRWTCQPYRLLRQSEMQRMFSGASAIRTRVRIRTGRGISGPAWFRAPRVFLTRRQG